MLAMKKIKAYAIFPCGNTPAGSLNVTYFFLHVTIHFRPFTL